MRGRPAATLIEVLVASVTLAVLVALIIGAVHKVRLAAVHSKSCNNLRQISLALMSYSDLKAGRLGSFPDKADGAVKTPAGGWNCTTPGDTTALYYELLPWTLGNKLEVPTDGNMDAMMAALEPVVPAYTSPGDPSLVHPRGQPGNVPVVRSRCSYAANLQVFQGKVSFPACIIDGTSSTVGFAEKYFLCGVHGYDEYHIWGTWCPPLGPAPFRNLRRPSFADPAAFDVIPTKDKDGRTVASQPGRTFQVRPRVEDADGKVLQTPFAAGLPVALFDGSVRTLSPGIDESVFWGLVTPAGGEIPGDF